VPLTQLRPCRCPEVCDRLSEYLDGEMGPVDRARLGLHLAACPPCAEASASLGATVRALHRLAFRRALRRRHLAT
jgi:anti-sigma factor (TIGR02949 family)